MPKHNNSLIFEWNNRNNPPNYAIQLMRSPSFLYIYICPKCITFNNTLSPQLHIATQVSPQPNYNINIYEPISQTYTLNHIIDSITT